MKIFYQFTTYCIAIFLFLACGSSKNTASYPPTPKVINLALTSEAVSNKYVHLDYGIRLNIKDGRSNNKILQKYDASAVFVPQVTTYPEIMSFLSESTRRYMRTMGFNLDADVSTDYMLSLTLKELNLGWLSGIGWSATVQFSIEVHDQNRTLVYPNVSAIGRANQNGNANDFELATKTINIAYANALQDIDWDRIAFWLKKAPSPKLETNKQVTGEGNTALEASVIRWYIESSPRGADVYSRIISSTPEVKNTNQNFIGSTPYESTETFDIKGLTFNNYGNVQIEIICEKKGYIAQRRRFNLRQVIEQKEISTKFNLIEEE